MSLRDQLLRSGLADKKQARKALQEKRKEKKARGKSNAPPETAFQEAKKRQEAQKEADRQLNHLLQQKKLAREKFHQFCDILLHHDQKERYADEPYYFVKKDQQIARIFVTPEQVKALAKGALGIVYGGDFADDYFLLDQSHCDKITRLSPNHEIYRHPSDM